MSIVYTTKAISESPELSKEVQSNSTPIYTIIIMYKAL